MITTDAVALASYRNGDWQFTIHEDGTLIKETEVSNPKVTFPNSLDLKITDYCTGGCSWCHERSTPKGQHGDLDFVLTILQGLPAGAEVAIGGGNPLDHPRLVSFLQGLKQHGIIANITVNEKHLPEQLGYLVGLIKQDLVKGVGISYSGVHLEELKLLAEITPNLVMHVIMGVHPLECLDDIQAICRKVLILGYKQFGRGNTYFNPEVEENKYRWLTQLPRYFKSGLTLSFDNLAIAQLKLRRLFPDDLWEQFYMGDDGTHTMYMDAVKKQYAVSSTSSIRFPLRSDIRSMFATVRSIL